ARHAFDRLADDVLGVVGRGGVEEIDAHVQGLADKYHGFGPVLPGAEPQPAEAAAAEAGDGDLEPGSAERRIFHDRFPYAPARRARWGASSPTPTRWPKSCRSRPRSASGRGGASSEAMLVRRCSGSPVPKRTTSTPGSCRTKR